MKAGILKRHQADQSDRGAAGCCDGLDDGNLCMHRLVSEIYGKVFMGEAG